MTYAITNNKPRDGWAQGFLQSLLAARCCCYSLALRLPTSMLLACLLPANHVLNACWLAALLACSLPRSLASSLPRSLAPSLVIITILLIIVLIIILIITVLYNSNDDNNNTSDDNNDNNSNIMIMIMIMIMNIMTRARMLASVLAWFKLRTFAFQPPS